MGNSEKNPPLSVKWLSCQDRGMDLPERESHSYSSKEHLK